MKEICKYRLPCGRCDKFDINCDLTYQEIEFMSKLSEKSSEEECEHEWKITGGTISSCNVVHYYTCSKCGEKKSLSIGI